MNGSRTATIIADAHQAFREGVREHLGYGFVVVGEAASVSELEQVASATKPALVLVGKTLPGGGLAAAVDVIPPAASLVVFADEPGNEHVVEALKLGASGYLLKSISAKQLDPALRAVMSGEHVLDRSVTGQLAEQIAEQRLLRRQRLRLPTGEHVVLTARENEVATLLHAGRSTKAIAEELGISAVTVRRHISVLMQKLQVANRTGAIQLIAG
ncbi:MAG: LuxR C-terminal-related transcriptional regulator [Gaiellaceae bacterium]